jgi:von Willebrand factor type A domain
MTTATGKKTEGTLIIDKSGSMANQYPGKSKSKWELCQEGVSTFANYFDVIDPDGFDLIFFAGRVKYFGGVTAAKVASSFLEVSPGGTTDLALAIQEFGKAALPRLKTNPNSVEQCVIVFDGEPDDEVAVMKAIINITKELERDDQMGITIVGFGCKQAPGIAKFLKRLDDELLQLGAKFDIVNCIKDDELEDFSLGEVLKAAIED